MRIDYVWTTGEPIACDIITNGHQKGASLSDHMPVQARIKVSCPTILADTRGPEETFYQRQDL